jgi:putative transcription factor
MRCEVCGRKIHSDPVRANIEGAILTVCVECSKHGKVVHQEFSGIPSGSLPGSPSGARPSPTMAPSSTKSTMHLPTIQKKPPVAQVQITTEVVTDYAAQIRNAREKLGLTIEDLGKKINEKASLLRHVENNKVPPNNQLANKLERVLKITLMVPIADEKVSTAPVKGAGEGLTLGDLIEMDKGDEEASTKRKPS